MHADIFCRVVDHFGDIGVTWRLTRQLQQEHGWMMRLWVDDLASFQRIEPTISRHLSTQQIGGVEIVEWTEPAPDLAPHTVALSSFSCALPDTYLARIREQPYLWINLEYLSAERWVEDCHALPSLRSDGLKAHFFFPGFTPRTGGLLRERCLLHTRNAWRVDTLQQYRLIKSLGVPEHALHAWRPAPESAYLNPDAARLVSLFCYPHAPLEALVEVLSKDIRPTVLLVPQGVAPDLLAGNIGQLEIVRVPFVSQSQYDRVLWTADLNFVRGEDSILRALWAGKPFIWQIYPQSEQTHLKKLESWLALSELPARHKELMLRWNSDDVASSAQQLLKHALQHSLQLSARQEWATQCEILSHRLALQPDFASSLDQFCKQTLSLR